MKISQVIYLIFSCSGFFIFHPVFSQKIDSLKSLIQKTIPKDQLLLVYNEISWEYRESRADSSLIFAFSAELLADSLDNSEEKIKALNYQGVAYRNLGSFARAFEKYLSALRLAEKVNNKEQRGYSLINLGNLYLYQTNFTGSIEYFEEALIQAKELKDERMEAYCYINLGRAYRGLTDWEKSIDFFQKCISIRRKFNDEYGEIAALLDLADVYRRRGDNEKSLGLYNIVLKQMDEGRNPRGTALAYNNISKIYLSLGKMDSSHFYAERALNISKKVSSRFDLRESYKTKSQISNELKDFKNAFESYLAYAQLNEQLFSEENIRKIEQLKNQYEFEQKNIENDFLRRQNELNKEIIQRQKVAIILGIFIALLLVAIILLIYKAYIARSRFMRELENKNKQILTDKQIIENQAQLLNELNETKSKFFANVSHDLRSPLSLIIGNLDLIQADSHTAFSALARKCLETSIRNSRRLLRLTDEINDLIKLKEGKVIVSREDIPVNSFLTMILEAFSLAAQEKGIELKYESTLADSETIYIDPYQFEKVIYNLVSNAIKHTRVGGVTLFVEVKNQNTITIHCIDTGTGIDPDSLPFIFDRYYQAESQPTSVSTTGLGIGLALVKDILHLHGAEINVESEIGKGTKFTVSIQRGEKMKAQLDIQPSVVGQSAQNSEPVLTTAKFSIQEHLPIILLVDDHADIRYYIKQLLEDSYQVVEAAHGIEALDFLKRHKIDVVICDLLMPWMDGFELIQAINEDENLRQLPILVISARLSRDQQNKVLDAGINDFLQKPFSKKDLVQRIENLLLQKEKYRSLPHPTLSSIIEMDKDAIAKNLVEKLEKLVAEKIADPNLSVSALMDGLAASERQTYRLVKRLTGLTPHEYIQEVRMLTADYIIRKNKAKNATEAARLVGINNVTTFSRMYEKKFGIKPSDLLKS